MKNKLYVCPYQGCGKSYSAPVNLKRHVECIHLRLKDFICHFCNKQLSSKQNFREHLYIHTGEKPFTCKLCGDAFRQGSQLSQHKKIHAVQRPTPEANSILKLTILTQFSPDRFLNPNAQYIIPKPPQVLFPILLPNLEHIKTSDLASEASKLVL